MRNYYRLDMRDRIKIFGYLAQGLGVTKIAEKVGRSKSTISRELSRCRGYCPYDPSLANADSAFNQGRRRYGIRKLDLNDKLREEVFSGLKKRWSPEQISKILIKKYPRDKSMRISHEAIYTYIYVLPRGELRKELTLMLRQRKKYRQSRTNQYERRGQLPEMISIEERPKNVESRSLPGHWEGDLIIGKNQKSALGTLVERKTRALILVPLKNDRSPKTVRRAFEKAIKSLPKKMRISLTYDRGFEMREHQLFTKNTKMKVYFCHPASPWQRGTCENTNGLIRDYFPKGTDFAQITLKELHFVQNQLNERPRKALDYRTPKEALNEEILSLR